MIQITQFEHAFMCSFILCFYFKFLCVVIITQFDDVKEAQMDFQELIFDDSGPIYLQVVKYFKKKLLTGELQHGDELPSRRIMSATLGLNLTTIQKIYKQLEEERLIDTQPNSKTTVCVTEEKLSEIKQELVEGQIEKFIEELKSCQVSREVALSIINKLWN